MKRQKQVEEGSIYHNRRKKEKTVMLVFAKYVFFYTAGALFWILALFLIFFILEVTGEVLPANHLEVQLSASADDIRKEYEVTEDLLPDGCTYGVYEYNGTWLYGSFLDKEREQAWDNYEKNSIYARGGGYYRFFIRDNQEICIVKYEIASHFRNRFLREYLPGADILIVISFIVLFIGHTVFISYRFGRYMKQKLDVLSQVTAQIGNQNLEFEEEHSDLREVEEVLNSLNQMRKALKDSLSRQWNLEKSKNEQIAALAHDIKTPLTIIRGNAELLKEGELAEDEREYNQDILQSVTTIEEYLSILHEIVLPNERTAKTQKYARIDEFAGKLKERTRLLAATCKCRVSFHEIYLQDEGWRVHKNEWRILCDENQILRAFDNILRNALEYTETVSITGCMDEGLPSDGQIQIWAEIRKNREQKKQYLVIRVEDNGPGFTQEGIKYAAERFYQGDKSRSSGKHYGIGLHSAKKFIEAQGGSLLIENRQPQGARVSLFILLVY